MAADDDDRADAPSAVGSLLARLGELERHRSFNVAERLAEAAELERLAGACGDVRSKVRARLVTADMLHRVGDPRRALRLATDLNEWAVEQADGRLIARTHLVLSSICEGLGDLAAGLDHAIRGLGLIDGATAERERGNHLLRLADALAVTGSITEARHRYHEAAAVFSDIADTERKLNTLNNLIVLENRVGDRGAALAAASRLAETAGIFMSASFAETVARVFLANGEFERAADSVALGLHLLGEQGDEQPMTPAALELTNAEVALALGRIDEAEAALERCLETCAQRGLAEFRVHGLAVRSMLLAASGRFECAYKAHQEFHAAYVAQRALQDDAAARALFDTAEARHEARQFWRQARTDPLTDLFNRRYVSEVLPLLLNRWGGDPARPVVAALFDVDHFKRINDDFDHTTGDEVLRRFAEILESAMPTPGGSNRSFAARLGGEEFLVVQVGGPANRALDLVDQLLGRVREHDWSSIARGVSLTVSAGVAIADATDTQFTLLSRADARLYEAKAAGRDRCVADALPPAA